MAVFISNSAILTTIWVRAALTVVPNYCSGSRKMADFGCKSEIEFSVDGNMHG